MLTSSILAAGDVLVGYGVPHLDTSAYGDGVTTVVLAVVAFVIGCFIGSFLNVVIWRVPNGISLVNPKRSFCPNCKSPIRWHDTTYPSSRTWCCTANAVTAKSRSPGDIRWLNCSAGS